MSPAAATVAALDLTTVRTAQQAWAQTGIAHRLKCVRTLRALVAEEAQSWASLIPEQLERTAAETITSELIPLAEACRFLELKAKQALAPEHCSTQGRPLWLRGVHVELRHEPVGVVLVVGPSNYPLFLAGVQCIQALVAGNAVLLKPGRDATPILEAFQTVLSRAGFPAGLVTLLPECTEAVHGAIAAGCDKVVITGSYRAGVSVLETAARYATPLIAELSGDDPVFVLPSADLARAAKAIAFGRKWNNGNTCIAPKRIYAHASVAESLRRMLGNSQGVVAFATTEQAVELARDSEYALGATIFGKDDARKLANAIPAGVVVINDMIVPTADPRVPFGGSKRSGFGRTRGLEGLLQMTNTKAVVVQRARRLRHLETLPAGSEALFLCYLRVVHGNLRGRFAALLGLLNRG